jgi:hypothetical protein
MKKNIFSLPLNPILTEDQFNGTFIPFVTEYKDWIYDIYFTCRVPPFTQDAMGAIIQKSDRKTVFENAMSIQEQTGIRISATFNNVNVSPSWDNYQMFCENLKPLYDQGLRSMTIPHGHWVAMGLKDLFPEMEIKNTILRKVATAQDYVYNAEQGFDYINLDRILMRDSDELSNIRRAQKYIEDKHGRYVKIALLTNEGCLGRCPVMDEHYSYNNLRQEHETPYFRHEISKVTCVYKWEKEDPAFFFKVATIPPFRKEYDELLEYVDIFKMHGRDNIGRLEETFDIIMNYAKGEELLTPLESSYNKNNQNLKLRTIAHLDGVPVDELNGWRKFIKNCKFNCWDCNYCDRVAESKRKKYND